jgi:hypothetical protein
MGTCQLPVSGALRPTPRAHLLPLGGHSRCTIAHLLASDVPEGIDRVRETCVNQSLFPLCVTMTNQLDDHISPIFALDPEPKASHR